MEQADKANSRKRFLQQLVLGWITLIFSPLAYVVARYVSPPRSTEEVSSKLSAGKLQDIPENELKIVRFNKKPVAVMKTSDGQVRALSTICTHLGCVVQFQSDRNQFHCNCHDSIFDMTGQNIGGPAPRPLQPFRVEVKGDQVFVSQI